MKCTVAVQAWSMCPCTEVGHLYSQLRDD